MLIVIPKVTTKKISKKYTHTHARARTKGIKTVYNNKKNQTKKKAVVKECQKSCKTHTKTEIAEVSSSLISNYYKCEWIKLLNQKVETDRMDKKQNPTICCLQDIGFR